MAHNHQLDKDKRPQTRQVDAEGKINSGNNPPAETRWKKGCPSPNPKGRPSKAEGLEVLDEILAREDPVSRKTAWCQLWEVAVRRAKQGSVKHFDFIVSYKLGKPKQSIEATGLGAIPVEIVTNVQIPPK